jgi:hypothetical protein
MPYLFDSESNDRIGAATAEQYAASILAGEAGHILIDISGVVVKEGSWEARQPGTRKVFVA